MQRMYLIYSSVVKSNLNQIIQHPLVLERDLQITPIKWSEFASLHVHDNLNHALVWVEQEHYPQLLLMADRKKLSLGLLPVPGDRFCQFYKNLEFPTSLDMCLEIAIHPDPVYIDLIVCNGVVVTNGVNLENQTAMAEFLGDNRQFSGWGKLQFAVRRFIHAFSLRPHPVTLITAKGKVINTAITGMVLLDFHKASPLTRLFDESVSMRDRRISMALFAPQSIVSYLTLSLRFPLKTSKKNAPQQIGYIRTASLQVKTPVDTHYLVNDQPVTQRELKLDVLGEGVRINTVACFKERHHYHDDKENVACDQLPQLEERLKYLTRALPFFTRAVESDFKELFLSLKENAQSNGNFLLLMVLSSMLATLGLFLNSPSVVIGAMVLAPLMAPIISLSMGLLRSDPELGKRSFQTLLIGISLALGVAFVFASLLPFHEVTNEIEGRLHPSTLDLLVAILSGVAGALANVRDNIAKSLPGVAIAVALVPPLCVSGIGLGWMNLTVFSGAMLLFLTNLAGIVMAAGLTFMLAGFSPFSRARKGIVLSLLLVAAVSVPLYISFKNMKQIAAIKQQIATQQYTVQSAKVQLKNISVYLTEPLQISGDLLITSLPEGDFLPQLEQQIAQRLGQPLQLNVAIHWVSQTERVLNQGDRTLSQLP